MSRVGAATEAIRELAESEGLRASLHARPLVVEGVSEVDVNAGVRTPIASLFKLPLAACWAELVAAGRLDPRAPLALPADDRAPGLTGVAVLADPVSLSQRDAVRLMLTVSDNACAEAVLELVGQHELRDWLEARGLPTALVRRGSATSLQSVIAETGGRDLSDALARLADPSGDRGTSEYDAALTSSGTARQVTDLLAVLWDGPAQEWVRESLRLQAWRHRIGSGFPHDDVSVAGKTGTIGRLRHEAAVVEFPHEAPVAVAVLTTSVRPEIHQPRADAAIGRMARLAVHALRRPL